MTALTAQLIEAMTRRVVVMALDWEQLPRGWVCTVHRDCADGEAAVAEFRGKYGRMPRACYAMPDGTYCIPYAVQAGVTPDELP